MPNLHHIVTSQATTIKEYEALKPEMVRMFDDENALNRLMARKEFFSNWDKWPSRSLAFVLARIAQEQIDKEIEDFRLYSD